MQKQRIYLIAGVVLAILAAVMSKAYLEQQRMAIIQQEKEKIKKAQANLVTVFIAAQDIPPGMPMRMDLVSVERIPSQSRVANAYTGALDGLLAAFPFAKGDQIVASKLISQKQIIGLADATPPGKRAVSISVDNTASLVGMLKPGNHVDVLFVANIPDKNSERAGAEKVKILPLFQNILILAVGQDLNPTPMMGSVARQSGAKDSSLITLALSPRESNIIAFAQEHGKISLALRSPSDSQISMINPVDWEELFHFLMPDTAIKAPVSPDRPTIEIYRGLKKERMPLSSR